MNTHILNQIEWQLAGINRNLERIALALEIRNETSQKEEKEEATEI